MCKFGCCWTVALESPIRWPWCRLQVLRVGLGQSGRRQPILYLTTSSKSLPLVHIKHFTTHNYNIMFGFLVANIEYTVVHMYKIVAVYSSLLFLRRKCGKNCNVFWAVSFCLTAKKNSFSDIENVHHFYVCLVSNWIFCWVGFLLALFKMWAYQSYLFIRLLFVFISSLIQVCDYSLLIFSYLCLIFISILPYYLVQILSLSETFL